MQASQVIFMRQNDGLFLVRLCTLLAFVLGVMPLGLSSTEMWDGGVGIASLAQNDWVTLGHWILDSNWYLTYGFFVLADLLHEAITLPYWGFFKLWIVLMVVGVAHEVRQLAVQVFGIPSQVAAWLPALVFAFPIWYVFFSYTPMLGHLTCVWLALIGYRLLYAEHKAVQAVGAVLVAVSFQLASNCAFVLALEAGRWYLCKDKSRWRYGRSALLLVLALAVFAATRVVWPPVGTYVGYNRLMNPLQVSSWLAYAKYLAFFGTWLLLLLPATVFAVWRRTANAAIEWKTPLVLAGLALAACAAYIGVGLGSPLFTATVGTSSSVSAALAGASGSASEGGFSMGVWYGGWGARHVLLLMVVMVVFAGWLLARRPLPVAKTSLAAAALTSITLSLAIGVPGHWAKLKRIAKEQAVVTALTAAPRLPAGEVDLLLDRREDYLNTMYEANYLLLRAYGQTRWAAVMLPDNPVIQTWTDENRQLALNQPGALRALNARLNLMQEFSWANRCKTIARIELPALSAWDVLWRASHAPDKLPKARLMPVSSTCDGADEFWRR